MDDVQRLRDWFANGRLLEPNLTSPTTTHLARTLAVLNGAPMQLDEPAQRLASAIGESPSHVLILADGLGMNLVEALPEASFLRRHLSMEIRSVFPSATAPAITSLATGAWPGEHAVFGWFAYLAEHNVQAVTLPFVERFTGRDLHDVGVFESDLFKTPPIMGMSRRSCLMLMPASIANSTYTHHISGGCRILAYDSLTDAVAKLLEVMAGGDAPGFTYFYYSRVDSASHVHGPGSASAGAEVSALDTALQQLHEALAGRARIVVSADHGQYDVEAHHRLILDPESEIMALLQAPPSGEPRVPLFHVKPGRGRDFARLFQAEFGDHFALLSAAEVDELRLLGPERMSAAARLRFGDFMGISAEGEAMVYGPDHGIADMLGYHGGLEPEEVRIPLVLA